MQENTFVLLENTPFTDSIYRMRLQGAEDIPMLPGQFVNLKIPGVFLRRPISVCDWEGGVLTLIYRVVGEGTRIMADMKTGQEVDLLTGLGNGYDLSLAGERPLLVGGGVGIPPLYFLAKGLRKLGLPVSLVVGFRNRRDVFMDAFSPLGCDVTLVTEDGSMGEKGLVIDHLPKHATHLFACGPEPMLRALSAVCPLDGQYSLEARMGCGFGACMGCTMETLSGPKRICREGPVLRKGDLPW